MPTHLQDFTDMLDSLRANINDPTLLYIIGAVVLIIGLMILRRVIYILIFFIIIGTALVVLTPDRKIAGTETVDQAKGIAWQVADKIQSIRDTIHNFQETEQREKELTDDRVVEELTK
jgi:hypothetical protein